MRNNNSGESFPTGTPQEGVEVRPLSPGEIANDQLYVEGRLLELRAGAQKYAGADPDSENGKNLREILREMGTLEERKARLFQAAEHYRGGRPNAPQLRLVDGNFAPGEVTEPIPPIPARPEPSPVDVPHPGDLLVAGQRNVASSQAEKHPQVEAGGKPDARDIYWRIASTFPNDYLDGEIAQLQESANQGKLSPDALEALGVYKEVRASRISLTPEDPENMDLDEAAQPPEFAEFWNSGPSLGERLKAKFKRPSKAGLYERADKAREWKNRHPVAAKVGMVAVGLVASYLTAKGLWDTNSHLFSGSAPADTPGLEDQGVARVEPSAVPQEAPTEAQPQVPDSRHTATPEAEVPVDTEPDKTETPAEGETIHYSEKAQTIGEGEGWFAQAKQMGLDSEQAHDLVYSSEYADLRQDLIDQGVAYRMPNGDFGMLMTEDGRMPDAALDSIADAFHLGGEQQGADGLAGEADMPATDSTNPEGSLPQEEATEAAARPEPTATPSPSPAVPPQAGVGISELWENNVIKTYVGILAVASLGLAVNSRLIKRRQELESLSQEAFDKAEQTMRDILRGKYVPRNNEEFERFKQQVLDQGVSRGALEHTLKKIGLRWKGNNESVMQGRLILFINA